MSFARLRLTAFGYAEASVLMFWLCSNLGVVPFSNGTKTDGAGNGNRTRMFGLEGRRTSHCTIPAWLS